MSREYETRPVTQEDIDQVANDALTRERRRLRLPKWPKERNIGVIADRIATEAVRRIVAGEALGTPSWHNIIREAAIDILDKEAW